MIFVFAENMHRRPAMHRPAFASRPIVRSVVGPPIPIYVEQPVEVVAVPISVSTTDDHSMRIDFPSEPVARAFAKEAIRQGPEWNVVGVHGSGSTVAVACESDRCSTALVKAARQAGGIPQR